MNPLAIDLFCGLGGWTEGLLAEGYYVIGFDITQHVYGEHRYPAQLVLQDVLTLHGRQFKDAALIVASPPCQAYSWRAMPWKAAKDALCGSPEQSERTENRRTTMNRADQAKLADKIAADWADKGKLIEGGWRAFVVVGGLKDAPEQQLTDMRKAYMLGAQHLFASIMGILDPGSEPTAKNLKRMDLIHEELEAFRRSLTN